MKSFAQNIAAISLLSLSLTSHATLTEQPSTDPIGEIKTIDDGLEQFQFDEDTRINVLALLISNKYTRLLNKRLDEEGVSGDTLMHLAARLQSPRIFKSMVIVGGDPCKTNFYDLSAKRIAGKNESFKGRLDLNDLEQRQGLFPANTGKFEQILVHAQKAAEEASREPVPELYKKIKVHSNSLLSKYPIDNDGRVMALAAYISKSSGTAINEPLANTGGETVLHYAARQRSSTVFKALIIAGGDDRLTNVLGISVKQLACDNSAFAGKIDFDILKSKQRSLSL